MKSVSGQMNAKRNGPNVDIPYIGQLNRPIVESSYFHTPLCLLQSYQEAWKRTISFFDTVGITGNSNLPEIMRNDDDTTIESINRISQRINSRNVQAIRGFVEQ